MNGFIAVDGGGSKTEIVLASEQGKIYHHFVTTCTNPNDIGINNSIKVLTDALKQVVNKSKDLGLDVNCIMLAIAGIEFGDLALVLKRRLTENLQIDSIHVKGDLASVVELHLSDKNEGVVIISGTGFNMAFKQNSEVTTVGGWGYIPDNYLSGFDLGKDALIAASKAIDMVGNSTCLVEKLESYYGHNLWYAMDEIYKSGIKGIAYLSRFVAQGYLEGDLVCKQIIDQRISNLAQVIKVKTNNESRDIFLCGGIFENNPFIVNKLNDALEKKYTLRVSANKTIYGAARLAIRSMKDNVDKEFLSNFDKSYKEVNE